MKRVAMACVAVVVLGLSGCAFKGEGLPVPGLDGGGFWQAKPVAMRVYPSTRFAREGQTPLLEAQIELLDEMGDSIKAAGNFRLELFAGDMQMNPALGRRLYRWDVALRSVEDQKTYYDPVTRAYLFRLRIEDLSIARRATTLEVTYTPPTGDRMEARAVIARQR